MAFAFIVQRNFETGDDQDWDTKTDSDTALAFDALDFPHYTNLARFPDSSWAPASGAYCMRVRLGGNDADATLTEADVNIAANVNNFLSFDVNFSGDFTGTVDDEFALFEMQAGGTVEGSVQCRIVAATNVISLGIGAPSETTSFSSLVIQRNRWYTIELDVSIDESGNNDGTMDIFITEVGKPTATTISATQLATIDQGAITDGVLGVQDQATTTSGSILFDNFFHDDTRLFSRRDRFPRTVLLTRSGHAFVGPGTIANVTLLSGAGTDNVLRLFDTDQANINDEFNVVVELKNTANNETVDPAGMPVEVHRGCYVDLAGADPRAVVLIERAAGYGSSAAIRNMGRAIKQLA